MTISYEILGGFWFGQQKLRLRSQTPILRLDRSGLCWRILELIQWLWRRFHQGGRSSMARILSLPEWWLGLSWKTFCNSQTNGTVAQTLGYRTSVLNSLRFKSWSRWKFFSGLPVESVKSFLSSKSTTGIWTMQHTTKAANSHQAKNLSLRQFSIFVTTIPRRL